MKSVFASFALPILLLVAGCSSSEAPSVAAPTPGAPLPLEVRSSGASAAAAARAPWTIAERSASGASPAADDAGADTKGGVYPAFAPNAPRLVSSGGPVIAAPKVVTVTWDTDTARGVYEALAAGLGGSGYWSASAEWGVGPAIDGGHVHVSGSFALSAETIGAFVQSHVGGAPRSGWPAYVPGTIYALYVPLGATFTSAGAPYCGYLGLGYHSATALADGTSVPYVVTCGWSLLEDATATAVSALASAATNPSPIARPSYASFDAEHVAFDIYESLQSEVGLACGYFDSAFQAELPPFPFTIQALWSNAAVAGGHSPCVPAIAGDAYYNTTTFPPELDDVTVDLSATGVLGKVETKGIRVALGTSKTFSVGFYSDAPTSDWTLEAVSLPTLPIADASGNPIPNGVVDVTIDRPTGHNGHVALVTVTPRTRSPSIGAEYLELQSGHAEYSVPHTLPILIGQ